MVVFTGSYAHPSLNECDVHNLTRIARVVWQMLIATPLAFPFSAYAHQAAAAAATPAPPAPAGSEPATPDTITVRAGDHGTYTRVVFVLPPGTSYRSTKLGDLLVLTFPGVGKVPGMQRLPPRILSITGGDNQAAIGLAAGMNSHIWRIGDRLIIDIASNDEERVPQPPAAPPAPPSLPRASPPPASAPH